jgi:hypothetical protein
MSFDIYFLGFSSWFESSFHFDYSPLNFNSQLHIKKCDPIIDIYDWRLFQWWVKAQYGDILLGPFQAFLDIILK